MQKQAKFRSSVKARAKNIHETRDIDVACFFIFPKSFFQRSEATRPKY
jgi:hypothetical protein